MPKPDQLDAITKIFSNSRRNDFGIYLGIGPDGPVYAPSQHGALILGPPRSGKTTSIVIPNVLSAVGSVLSVSTKRDVLNATARARAATGECLLFDPSGSLDLPTHVRPIGWSPIASAHNWDRAVLTAEAMVGAARQFSGGDASHWLERAGALLSCSLHASALAGASMNQLVGAVNRHDATEFKRALSRNEAGLANDLLEGITDTDPREQSGIWSTCSGVLAAYRTESALASTSREAFEPERFVHTRSTLYIAAGAEHQRHVAPLVAGIVRDIRSTAYARSAQAAETLTQTNGVAPTMLILDELANIAPLHDLPALVAEGASQGILTLASLQDLSQARDRWGVAADGFLSLFGTKLLLGGIGDTRTLESLSLLAGEHEVTHVTRTHAPRVFARRPATRSISTRSTRVLPPADIARPRAGTAVVVLGAHFSRINLTPYFTTSPWREAALTVNERALTAGRAHPNLNAPGLQR